MHKILNVHILKMKQIVIAILKGKCESTMETPTYYYENLVTVLQMSNVVCLNLIVLQCNVLHVV